MVCTVDELNVASQNFEADDQIIALKTMYLQSAQESVESYLRYHLEGTWDDELKAEILSLWSPATTIPVSIKEVILNIAAHKVAMSGGNSSVASYTVGDVTRTFVSNREIETMLKQIRQYRLVRF